MLRFLILLANILSLASIANSQQTSSVPQRVLAASFVAGSPDDAGRLMGARKCGFSPCTAEDGMLAMDIGRISPGLVKLMSGTSENREHRISWDVPTGASRCPSWVKDGKTPYEHMLSGLAQIADIGPTRLRDWRGLKNCLRHGYPPDRYEPPTE